MPPLDCVIRRAASTDLAELSPLFDAYRVFFAGQGDATQSLRFLSERFAAHDSVIFVARNGNEVDGFIQLYPLWSSWHCSRIWFLSDLYVKESSRGRGVGFHLVERVVAHARETDASSVIVELPHREPHLKDFYAKLGFHEDPIFSLARITLAHSP